MRMCCRGLDIRQLLYSAEDRRKQNGAGHRDSLSSAISPGRSSTENGTQSQATGDLQIVSLSFETSAESDRLAAHPRAHFDLQASDSANHSATKPP
ncbi:hypothetical protein RRG08_041134 [Elysia crispata]|uniref:Uncharacterized protein n=1 Tax=Elysia crispata TaxID=231223 RepID=A0AAE1CPA3_9GAST|nr:hypothetical protein RRG08_041134 [Elysia crispata]